MGNILQGVILMTRLKAFITLMLFPIVSTIVSAQNVQLTILSDKIKSQNSSTKMNDYRQVYKPFFSMYKSNNDFMLVKSYTESGEMGRLFDWHLSKIDSKGKVLISDKYLGSYHVQFTKDRYPSRTVIQIDNKTTLAFSQWAFLTGGEMFISILTNNGKITKRDSILDYLGNDPQLIKNSKNEIFIIGNYNAYWVIRRIYPSIDKSKKLFTFPGGLGSDFIALPLNDEKILICTRPWERATEFKNNELGCFVINYSGAFLSQVNKIDIDKDAYRIIKKAYLPGGAYIDGKDKTITGLDYIQTARGEYIISVNWWDENDSVCISQIKYGQNGELIKPDKKSIVNPISLKEKAFPKITKNGMSTITYKSKDGVLNKTNAYVFWGYDETDTFYWASIPIEKADK
jgi:hypothetical protein